MFPFCHTYLIRINLYNGKSSHFRVPFLSSPDFLTAHNHVIFYYPPLGGIQDTVNLISSRGELSATGSYTRLFKVTFVTGAGLTRAVIRQKIWKIWVCTIVWVSHLPGYSLCIEPLKTPSPRRYWKFLQQFHHTDGKTLFLGTDKPDMQNYKGKEIDLERATVD